MKIWKSITHFISDNLKARDASASKNSIKQLKQPTSVTSHWYSVDWSILFNWLKHWCILTVNGIISIEMILTWSSSFDLSSFFNLSAVLPRPSPLKYWQWIYLGYRYIFRRISGECMLMIRVHRIFLLFDFYSAHTFFFVFFNSKNNLFSYIFWFEASFLCKFQLLSFNGN